MSENALLVGLIKNRFKDRATLENSFHELKNLEADNQKVFNWIKNKMNEYNLDVGVQNFTFKYSKLFQNQVLSGQNIYGIIRSPGAAGSQTLLITAPLRHKQLLGSISTLLTLAKHARNAIYWGVDIIFLFTDMEFVGLKAWLNAYHGLNDPHGYIEGDELNPRSGSILAGFNVEIESSVFSHLEFKLESLNGRLPNLDLYNTFVRLSYELYIPVVIHGEKINVQLQQKRLLPDNTIRLLTMMWHTASGSPSGLHGLMSEFQVPSLTISAKSMTQKQIESSRYVGSILSCAELFESTMRCLNNLQERMHQSFFFYLLASPTRYISIGVYMIPFGVMCIGSLLPIVFAAYFKIINKENTITSVDYSNIWSYMVKLLMMSFGAGLLANLGMDYFLPKSKDFNIESGNALLFTITVISIFILVFCRISLSINMQSMGIVRGGVAMFLALFLGILSVLNISMAYFVGLLLLPLAICSYPVENMLLRATKMIGLIVTSPICVLLCSAAIHELVFVQNDFSLLVNLTDLFVTALDKAGQWMLQLWVEKDVLGSWTVDVITLGYLSFWTMFCCLSHFKP